MSDNLTKRSGICYNLDLSPYQVECIYNNDIKLNFIFSSKLYVNKFNEKIYDNREKINESLTNRFGMEITNNILCDIKLYASIEKRGFLILDGKESYRCLNNIKLDGNHLTLKNLQEL